MENVETITVINDLCTSCGICEAVCPQNCIKYKFMGGQYVPEIDENSCNNCGICLDICPGYKVDLYNLYKQTNQEIPDSPYTGNYRSCYTSYVKNNTVRINSTSGGCITAIVEELLSKNMCDVAFLLNSYRYDSFLETVPYVKGESLVNTPKSRYVPISHKRMIKYVLENRDAKVIIVATSCAVQGFLNVVSKFNLDRDNFLILGLLCEKTMCYNIFNYFNDYENNSSSLKKLYFRSKEKGGWPGQVKLEYESGEVSFLPSGERKKLKDYFQLERCLYCIDKLNQFADISFGDNYTGKNSSKEGSNSIIVRTKKGEDIWKLLKNKIESQTSSIDDIIRSQHIEDCSQNYEFAKIKGIEKNIDIYPNNPIGAYINKSVTYKLWAKKLHLINIGKNYPKKKLYLQIRIKFDRLCSLMIGLKRRIIKTLRLKYKGFVNR